MNAAVAHLPARPEGADQPGARPGAAVPDRLHLHLLGLHAGEERGDGRGQRLHRHRRRGRSQAARAVREAMLPPLFLPPREIPFADINRAMDTGKYTFVVDLPPEVPGRPGAGRQADVQIITDATAMSQAGRGPGYICSRSSTATISAFWRDRGNPANRAAGRTRDPRAASIRTCSRAGSSPSTR